MTGPDRAQPPKLLTPVFLGIGVLFGLFYALLLPPLQAPDEYGHFYRAYSVSTGACWVPSQLQVPQEFSNLNLLYPPRVELNRRITRAELVAVDQRPLHETEQYTSETLAVELYSCIPYLPVAAAMYVGRQMPMSALSLMYAGRLANLATFLVLVWLALRLLPDFHLLLIVLALLPMSLQQAASLSPDALTNATAYLLVGSVLSLATGSGPIPWRQTLGLSLVILVASLSKFNIWMVGTMALIPQSRFGGASRRWLWVGALILLSIAATTLWQISNHSEIRKFDASRAARGIDMAANAQFVSGHPVRFLGAVGNSLKEYGEIYAEQYIGRLGWLNVMLPVWLIGCYLVTLVCVTCAQEGELRFTTGQRMLLVTLFLGFAISTFSLLFTFETRTADLNVPGGLLAPGVQGRYFISSSFLLYLAFGNDKVRRWSRYVTPLALLVVLVGAAIGAWRIYHTYYVSGKDSSISTDSASALALSGTLAKKYEGQLVRRPGPTPEDGKVYVILKGEKHWVLTGKWMTSHGYHWPQDVKNIPAAELDVIPLGTPFE